MSINKVTGTRHHPSAYELALKVVHEFEADGCVSLDDAAVYFLARGLLRSKAGNRVLKMCLTRNRDSSIK